MATEIIYSNGERPQEKIEKSIDEIKKNKVVEENAQPGFDTMTGWRLIRAQAATLAQSNIIPKEYQKHEANCLVALNMATRLGADPLMVMQNLYIVYNRPSWSSQFLISTFNTCGRFTSIRYQFIGNEQDDTYGCYAYATEKATGEVLSGATVTIGLAKAEKWYDKSGSKWQTMPQQMLMYRAASWFIRAYAPEISMGLHTEDELRDTIIDVTSDSAVVSDEQVSLSSNELLKQTVLKDEPNTLFEE